MPSNENEPTTRLDKWLWATRLFKTRSAAAAACRGGKVKVDDEKAKPARPVRPGERVAVQKEGILLEVQVLAPLEKRVAAKLVPEFLQDLTPPEQYQKQRETLAQSILNRGAGTGRPTKRERRDIDRVFGDEQPPLE